MKKTYAAAGLVGIAIVLLFAVISFLRENWAADGSPGGLERWIARAVLSRSRAASDELTNPLPLTSETIASGKQLYDQHCAFCHGSDGSGQAAEGMQFYPPVQSLSAPPDELSDGRVFSIVKLGIRYTAMPGFSKLLSDDEIWKVTAFVGSLRRASESAK